MTHQGDITYFGRTNKRPPDRVFGIKQSDRLSHLYAIGRTGTGKSTLLETLALQDIRRGHGLAVIDPHGDLALRLVASVPEERVKDLVYLNPASGIHPYRYNPLRRVREDKIALAVSGVLEAFKKIWGKSWGVRMEHILRNALFALIEYGDATLPDILRLFGDKAFQARVLAKVTNEQVRAFWTGEYPRFNPYYRQEAIGPIQNKVGAFLADPRLRGLFTGSGKELSVRRLMDEGKILIVNLSKGELGEDSANLLGALLVSTVSLAAFSRAEIPEETRRDFVVYIDEFQNFTTLAVANMISELRKYRVGLVLAHQHLHQLEPDVRHAVLGNVGTLISFRLGAEDAAVIAREFAPKFEPEDLLNLPNHTIYLKLMVGGAPSRPFSGVTLRPGEVGV
jgi:type IV secretory pathway TraG/TraD family ATPase VirD4